MDSSIKEIDKEVEKKLLKMMQDNPVKLIQYFVAIVGREMVATNAGSLDLSQEMTVNDHRYKVMVKSSIKKVRQSKDNNAQVSDTTGDDSSTSADKHLDFITKEAQEMGLYD